MNRRYFRKLFFSLLFGCLTAGGIGAQETTTRTQARLVAIESRIHAYVPDTHYRDDAAGFIVVKEALAGLKSGSGGIGACLLDPATGTVVERGRNRQYTPYFRSDLHAEMDLLNRYEDRLKKKGGVRSGNDPRQGNDLILFSSAEPCPMCLTRIINAGIKRMYYLSPDLKGGMVHRMDHLPPFWKAFAADRDFRQADCSPALKKIAGDLFDFSRRTFAEKRTERDR